MARITDPSRDLLFGPLALQTGLINQSQVVAAFHTGTLDQGRSLADHLVALGHVDATQRAAIEALAALHIAKHGDAERSLEVCRGDLKLLAQVRAPAAPAPGRGPARRPAPLILAPGR
jgi:hypothetical protein